MVKRPQKVWQTIAQKISQQVTDGVWSVGSLIPKETDLAKAYGVSRDTVRKALGELTAAGLFERKPRAGTRVKAKIQSGRFMHELSDIRAIDHYGNEYPRRIQNMAPVEIDAAASRRLGLPEGAVMARFENLRIVSETIEEPVVVTYVYVFPQHQAVYLKAKDQPQELIISLVEELSGKECTQVKQTFSATKMPEAAAFFFREPAGSPALRIIRNYLDCEGRPIVVSESFHPADRFSFSVSASKRRLSF